MSDDSKYSDPRIAINRVYTRRGDGGETGLVGGTRLPKDAVRIEAYGTVDELNAYVGGALVSCRSVRVQYPEIARLVNILRRVQHELFNLGSLLATEPEKVDPRQPQVGREHIARLEREIDELNADLPALRSFVLPGGSRLSVDLHVCRTVCRRAERVASRLLREEPKTTAAGLGYLNRLSDAFFVFGRWADVVQGAVETLWDPNHDGEKSSASES
ncbi:MAG: cob(I)yrinic acid a,c-diamide adenosyltransferase [Deltaproteobacteria bacterium]|nr:cob(I)yrinic acid a,c-diamide adenosyltransferase [Deltaproteobacteria bacterium]